MSKPVYIPLLNVNEPEAQLAAVHVQEGQFVDIGDVICVLETSKSTTEVTADTKGYVIGLNFSEGQNVPAGVRLCFLSETPDWDPRDFELDTESDVDNIPKGLRITQPALTQAQQAGLDLSALPVGPLITVPMINKISADSALAPDFPLESKFDNRAILIYGGGGHGKSLIDLIYSLHTYEIAGILDDNLSVHSRIMGIQVLGGAELLPKLHAQGINKAVNAVGGIGNVRIRLEVFRQLRAAGFGFPTLVHPTAYVEPSATLAAGVQIFPQAYVGSEVNIGFGSIINTGAIVSHDCMIDEVVNISPGAILAGGVEIGREVLIGMGATVNLYTTIGAGSLVGNGATVKTDVPDKSIVKAGTIWPG
jgi:acetyltransferase EpsM